MSLRSLPKDRSVSIVVGTAVMALGVPLGLAATDGGLAFPHNDAWSYSLIAQSFGRHGDFELVGWNRGSLVGQIVPLGPVARSIVVQHLFVLALGLASLALVFHLVEQRTDRTMAALATCTTLVFPGYALLSTSFMQDIPAFFAGLCCLVLGQRALTGSPWVMWASMSAGLWGATIREQAIAAPVAVIVASAWVKRDSSRALVRLGAALLVVAAAFGLFEFWRAGLAGGDPPMFQWLPARGSIARMFRAYLTLALVSAPMLLTAVPALLRSRRDVLVVVSTALAEIVVVLAVPSAGRLLGGYLNPAGSYPAAYNGTREMIPGGLEIALIAAGMAAGAFVPLLVARGFRRLGPILTCYAAFLALGNTLVVFTGQSVFDRYLLPFLPLVAIVCGPPRKPAPVMRGAIAAVVLGSMTLALNVNALAIDAALWKTGESLVAHGVPARDVDAGFNWYGYHADAPADQSRMRSAPTEPFYLTLFPESRGCLAVMISPPTDGSVITTATYREFGFVGSATLWIVDTGRCALSADVLDRIRSRN